MYDRTGSEHEMYPYKNRPFPTFRPEFRPFVDALFCINTTFFTDKMTENILDLASQDQQPMIIIGDLNIDPQRNSAKYQQLAGG